MAYLRDRDQRALRSCNFSAGVDSLKALTTGIDNIAIGRLAIGTGVTTGTGNIGSGISNIAIG